MEDDDGRESFEINDMDLEYAMNPGGRRRFQNKDQATYGGESLHLTATMMTMNKEQAEGLIKNDQK
ncbi:Tuftelin interacting protein N-terminal domain-containing protein [Caenorhabditis elegans]|uniref:Tuftelin interacting protein N-terminal domain-containing protein n=1 Tax=Caenorhabditis elegans TaxID=6239 RepID=Q9U3R2_CAEEL|nr:Tuftelin interacting protein N-terminal domain-containing protein [Caenorhabditis elegans]CAA90102.3 Tuftelin interacting protein N-terminal domain-containing protein [Caenorhabditis elegans]|eukprot:NP_496227.2 Septin and tuftelin-interacting protein 1 homolog [Caenorhabditis elegans]